MQVAGYLFIYMVQLNVYLIFIELFFKMQYW